MSRLRDIASALREGFLRASAPVVPVDARPEIALTWLNEATLVGISVPAPRSIR
ncbi:hypothetical protein [Mycolicibacterium helvum]|uniref:hypothetical protein n=1 Tax=Mycolicibacterium helvum TaxID=1534349 RepID=UPI0013D1944D|nr:hypothetical protein [Mycolicibacterium helvum]